MANSLLRNFHNPNTETLLKGKGIYLYTKKISIWIQRQG